MTIAVTVAVVTCPACHTYPLAAPRPGMPWCRDCGGCHKGILTTARSAGASWGEDVAKWCRRHDEWPEWAGTRGTAERWLTKWVVRGEAEGEVRAWLLDRLEAAARARYEELKARAEK